MGRIAVFALRFAPTVMVGVLLILFFGLGAALTAPVDIFPNIDIPVVSVIWSYGGLSCEDFERRITTFSEVSLSTAVNDVKSIQSTTYDGMAIVRLYLQPEAKVETAIAQATASSQSVLKRLPPGITPPVVVRYSAASVPIIQLALTSPVLPESALYDFGLFRARQGLSAVRGTTVPPPYGGRVRQIRVDLDTKALQAHHLSARDINTSLALQNLVAPSGRAKIGDIDYRLLMNNSPSQFASLEEIPVANQNGRLVFLRDLAQVHDGGMIQTNTVRADGSRSVLVTVLKNGAESTLTIVDHVLDTIRDLQKAAPKGLNLKPLFDQSVFVRAALSNVLHEGALAGLLTGALILLFLGSWRSTLVVLASIPLALLSALVMLRAGGNTLNIMTLGGLSLAIGILVDDATVTIENIHRNAAMGKPFVQAILDGAKQIASPAFTVMMCICIVFASVTLLDGASYFLFVPFALSVVFSVFMSFVLSRTLVPVLVYKFLEKDLQHGEEGGHGLIWAVHHRFNQGFERFREAYSSLLWVCLNHPGLVSSLTAAFLLGSLGLLNFIGRDFFPTVDAGQFRLHVKCPAGTRLESAERWFSQVEGELRRIIPPQQMSLMLDNIGLPADSTSMAFSDSTTLDTSDGEILVSLKKGLSTPEVMRKVRLELHQKFPDLSFYFQPADMVGQILNAGLPSPIDVRISGKDRDNNLQVARALVRSIRQIPGAVDVRLHQETGAPALAMESDRTLLAMQGLTQRNLADDVLVAVSSNQQVSPTYWVDPKSGNTYFVVAQTPQVQLDSLDALRRLSVSTPQGDQMLGNLGSISRRQTPAVISHLNIQPTYDVFANVDERDLGAVGSEVNKLVAQYRSKLKPGNKIMVQGLVEQLDTTFAHLGMGFVVALVLVFLLLVVNFQSWVDAGIIVMALPGAASGILWGLYVTHTNFSVPSLMGAILSLGVATANSVLVIAFAREEMQRGVDSLEAAYQAGRIRLRPVLMTALAMIVGMVPMAMGLGEGGEQNAPLGRAVIGGLTVATVFTLLFVPTLFARLRRHGLGQAEDPTLGYQE
ncbi:RND transporter [bacterium SCN 62-11]|nr:efflux RND transporter permease subunit [Candidatus Eremiobacteraeota bacterium]ODT74525.1 MAG: RND transporter [bacterium SCN 62-11]